MIKINPNDYVEPKYIDVPWKHGGRDLQGTDCLGLVWKFLTDHGVDVPDGDGMPVPKDWKKKDAERLIRTILQYGDLAPLTKLKKLDAVLFALTDNSRIPDHLGVMVNDFCFLHILEPHPIIDLEMRGKSRVDMIDEFWKSRMCGAFRFGQPRMMVPEGMDVRVKL